jgi:ATP-dependent helicase/nuclease subunit B
VIIAGCREGALPSGTYDDPFIPDRAKKRLGLVSQDDRFARDAYLLSCLLASRPAGNVLLGFSRQRMQGEPNRPSRLLFGCEDCDLPQRSSLLLKPAPRSERLDRKKVDYRLRIPKPSETQWPPKSIRVTAFKAYLECPLRFYLGTILNLRKVDPDAREIPSTDFGTLLHKVLEDFARDKNLSRLKDANEIAREFSRLLDAAVPRFYGGKPSAVVRVQIENMRARLASAAATESIIRSDGWATLEAEYKIKPERQLLLGGLPITGTIDRIDVHPEKGLRILDYKTYSKPKNPSKTHLGPQRSREHLAEADVEILNKKGEGRMHSWTDLQLPLYAWLAGKIWPDHAAKGVEVGYFLLPPDNDDPEDALQIFELTDEMQASAERCAERIVRLVQGGYFWPPSPASLVEFDDFKDWFMQEDPRKLIDVESAHRLNGNL